jgi:hypothetical protein
MFIDNDMDPGSSKSFAQAKQSLPKKKVYLLLDPTAVQFRAGRRSLWSHFGIGGEAAFHLPPTF